MGVRNVPIPGEAAQYTSYGCQPRVGSPTGTMAGPLAPTTLCVAYTCGSVFSLLYVTEGLSPTSVYGGQGQGTLTRWQI